METREELWSNSQHLEDEGEAAQHSVGLRRQLDGQHVDGRADQETVDEVGLAVAPRWAALPLAVGGVVVALQLHQDLAGVDDGRRRGERQGGRRRGDGGHLCGRLLRGRRCRRGRGVGRQRQQAGGRRRGRLGAQQAERHRRLAVVLLLAAVADLLQAGGVVAATQGKKTKRDELQREPGEGKLQARVCTFFFFFLS